MGRWLYHSGIDEYWQIPDDYPDDAVALWATHGWAPSSGPPA